MTEWVSSTYSSGATDHKYIVEEEAPSIANHIQNNTALDTNSDSFGKLPFSGGDTNSEWDFANRALEYIDKNHPVTSDESIIIGHSVEDWGYGTAGYSRTTDQGYEIYGCLVYVGTAVVDYEKRLMTWHEAGHSWGASHGDGHYDLESGFIKNIKPMGCSYTYNKYGHVDMAWAGGGNIPPTFCGGLDNYAHEFDNSDLHEFGYSSCTLNRIESFFGY